MVEKFKGVYNIDPRAAYFACLFHDYGKIWDYDLGPDYEWCGNSHRRMIHHIPRSAIEWSKASERLPVDMEYLKDEVLHAILSHHGTREASSPVAPKTRVAWLVHLCDGISARMYDADTFDVVKGK